MQLIRKALFTLKVQVL